MCKIFDRGGLQLSLQLGLQLGMQHLQLICNWGLRTRCALRPVHMINLTWDGLVEHTTLSPETMSKSRRLHFVSVVVERFILNLTLTKGAGSTNHGISIAFQRQPTVFKHFSREAWSPRAEAWSHKHMHYCGTRTTAALRNVIIV